MTSPASHLPTLDDLRVAVETSSKAYATLKRAENDLCAFKESIKDIAYETAGYRPGLHFLKGYADLSASVAIAYADYIVAAGEVHRIRVANPSL